MEYSSFLTAMERYGSKREDICRHYLGVDPEQLHPTAILAPWWEPKSLPDLGQARLLTDPLASAQCKVWEITKGDQTFSYIKTGVGAPNFADAMLALGVTDCRRVLFVGSVGALDDKMEIGDLVLPSASVTGDGVSRYLCGTPLSSKDPFGTLRYPHKALWEAANELASAACAEKKVGFHIAKAYSIDTVFAQFYHLEEILAMGCTAIDMESAVFFTCAQLMGLESCAFFIVSDNTLHKQSLVSGRTAETEARRRLVRKQLLPEILTKLIL